MSTPAFVTPTPIDENHLFLIEKGVTREDLYKLMQRRLPWERFAEYASLLPREDHMLSFISSYQGVFSYMVLSGPMVGKRIRVRPWSPEMYLRDWNPKTWNMNYDQYVRDVVNASGIVDCLIDPVTEDVLAAARYLHGGEYANVDLKTARYVVGSGWKIVSPIKM